MSGSVFCSQRIVSGSQCSPARNTFSSDVRSYFFAKLAFGSVCWIARNAVGAVNIDFTLYSSIIRQKAPASGVPTGFPSYMMVVQPWSRGP